MKFLENSLSVFLILTVAAFCWTVVHADTWDETTNGGGDAGDFPNGDFQASDDNSVTFDMITGNNAGDIDSYLITVTDAANFFIQDLDINTDTLAFVWDMGGNPLMKNDDNPIHEGDGDFSFGFGDAVTHPATPATGVVDIVGTPATLSNGDTIVLSIGGFGDTAEGDAGAVFLLDAGDFVSLVGPNVPASNFKFYNAAGAGAYIVELNGCELAFMGGKGCMFELGDVNNDGSVTLLDVGPFVDLLVSGDYQCEADIDESGAVDLLDVTPFVNLLAGG